MLDSNKIETLSNIFFLAIFSILITNKFFLNRRNILSIVFLDSSILKNRSIENSSHRRKNEDGEKQWGFGE